LGVDVDCSFPANFFMNPFAVSFPGDIEYCPVDQTLDDINTGDSSLHWTIPGDFEHNPESSRSQTTSPLVTVAHPTPTAYPASTSATPTTSLPTARTPISNHGEPTPAPTIATTTPAPLPSTTPKPLQQPPSPATTTTTTKDSSAQQSAKSGSSGFTFVDHSDRKTIMRLRNTMVSRKHRDNKVKRIAELEKLLAERDAELELLRARLGEGKRL
jgi:hypothetical protein